MGKGRKAIPTRVKFLQGKVPALIEGMEPQPEQGLPECPAWLDAMARAEWGRVAPEMCRLGVVRKVDAGILAAYCQAYSTLQAAQANVAQDGLTIEGRKNPAVTVAVQAGVQMRSMASELGLTPASRVKLRTSEPKKDALDEFLEPPKLKVARSG